MGSPSSEVRNAEGQTVSPVFELINSEPRIPGMTMTGRFPLRARAAAKMCSRFGVRRAEMHALETRESAIRLSSNCFERASGRLFNGHRPTTIDQAGDKPRAEAVVDIHHRHVRSAGVQHSEQCRDTSKRCAITDAGWHGHDRNADESADDGRQCTFHACGDDDDARTLQQTAFGEYAVNAR